MAGIRQGGAGASLFSIFKSGRYSDITICCSDRDFMVHRAIICPQCPFFAAACDGQFQESITKRIVLEDDDPDTVERTLTYLYTSDYDDECSTARPVDENPETRPVRTLQSTVDLDIIEPATIKALLKRLEHKVSLGTVEVSKGNLVLGDSRLLNNVRVYAIAEKYGIFDLKELAKTKFQSQADGLIFSDDFLEIIKMVYESTPDGDRGLRKIVLDICVEQLRTLMDNNDFTKMVKTIGGFGFDILCSTLKENDERLEQALADKAPVSRDNMPAFESSRIAPISPREEVDNTELSKDNDTDAHLEANTVMNGDRAETPLQAAARGGDLEAVERLLATNADVNAAAATGIGGLTALQAAAGSGHLEIVERLLAANADVNANAAPSFGRTAIQAAAEGGHLEVITRLLAAKADVNAPAAAKCGGLTALQAATEGGHLEVVERLKKAQKPPKISFGFLQKIRLFGSKHQT